MVERRKSGREDQTAATLGDERRGREPPLRCRTWPGLSHARFPSWLLASQLTSPSSQTAPKPNPEGGSPAERVCGGDRNGARSTGEGRRRMGATGRAAESAEASGTWLYWAGRRRGRGHRDGERLANVLRRKTEESVFFIPGQGV